MGRVEGGGGVGEGCEGVCRCVEGCGRVWKGVRGYVGVWMGCVEGCEEEPVDGVMGCSSVLMGCSSVLMPREGYGRQLWFIEPHHEPWTMNNERLWRVRSRGSTHVWPQSKHHVEVQSGFDGPGSGAWEVGGKTAWDSARHGTPHRTVVLRRRARHRPSRMIKYVWGQNLVRSNGCIGCMLVENGVGKTHRPWWGKILRTPQSAPPH